MASDSIIARPTNNVRVIVAEASGCWASELSAVATAFPSASAGPIVPKPVVTAAHTIDATAIVVMLSMLLPWLGRAVSGFRRLLALASLRGGRDVDRRENAE